MEVRDQSSDTSGRQYHQLLASYGLEDYCKQASREEVSGGPGVPRNLYADLVHSRFYCGTAPATAMSAAFFYAQKRALDASYVDVVEKRIKAAADFFSIAPVVERIRDTVASKEAHVESSLPDSDFALVWESGPSKERHYPLRNALEVKTAAEYLVKEGRQFDFKDRCTMARKVLAKAAQLKIVPAEQDTLSRIAGLGTASAEGAAQVLFKRAVYLKAAGQDQPLQRELAKLAKWLMDNPDQAHLPTTLYKVACVVDGADKKHNISAFDAPEDELFLITEKSAASFKRGHVALKNGAIYEADALGTLPLVDVKKYFNLFFS